jgi:hypothetical protein
MSGVVEEAASMKVLVFLIAVAWGIAGWAAYTAVRWSLARYWPAVPCVVTGSVVQDVSRERPYRFQVAYRYSWAGRVYDGSTYREECGGSADIAEADRLARAFPIGTHRICYVNPGNPSQAVLVHDPVWIPATVAVANLLAGAFFARLLVAGTRRRGALAAPFHVLLIAAGLGVYVFIFGLPLSKGLRSLGWQATPCVIQSGQVRSVFHGGWPSFMTYWPDVMYRYEVDGVAYRANTYNVSDVGSPWYYGARGVVRRHPPAMRATCYVNPADPSEAVMDRTPSGTQWFGVWPLGLAVMCALGIVESVTGRGIQLGPPRVWGTLALGAATTSALTILWITGTDLLRDLNEGVSEWPEYLAVAVAGPLSAGLVRAWVSLAVDPGGRNSRARSAAKPPVVWDPEIDRVPKTNGRPR